MYRRRSPLMLGLGVVVVLAELAAAAPVRPGEWQLRALLTAERTSALLAFSPDGKTLAVAGATEGDSPTVVRLWDLRRDKPKVRLTLTGHKQAILRIAFSADGKTLVSVGADGLVKRWGVARGKELKSFSVFKKAGNLVEDAWVTADGRTVAVRPAPTEGPKASTVRTVTFWSVVKGTRRRVLRFPAGDRAVALSPDGRMLLSGITDTESARDGNERSVLKLWSVATGQPIQSCRLVGMTVHGGLFFPSGKSMVAGCASLKTGLPGLVFWDVGAKEPRLARNPNLKGGHAYAFSADGRVLVTSSANRKAVLVWDLAFEKPLGSLFELEEVMQGATLSADGKTLAVSDAKNSVRMWTYKAP